MSIKSQEPIIIETPGTRIAPDELGEYARLYEQLSCRPPLKRNWAPAIAGAMIAAFASAVWVFM